jgi:hypothetical protein
LNLNHELPQSIAGKAVAAVGGDTIFCLPSDVGLNGEYEDGWLIAGPEAVVYMAATGEVKTKAFVNGTSEFKAVGAVGNCIF